MKDPTGDDPLTAAEVAFRTLQQYPEAYAAWAAETRTRWERTTRVGLASVARCHGVVGGFRVKTGKARP